MPHLVAVTCGSMSGVYDLRLGSIAVLTLDDEVTPPCPHSSIAPQVYHRCTIGTCSAGPLHAQAVCTEDIKEVVVVTPNALVEGCCYGVAFRAQ